MIAIINCGTDYLKNFTDILAEYGYPTKIFNLDEIKKCDFALFDGVVITGAPTNLTEVDLEKYLANFKFIKTIKIPILGICLGHQIMGALYGGKISKGEKIFRDEQIEILKTNALFAGLGNFPVFKEEHEERATLPNEFNLLAKSKSCDNEVMKHRTEPKYGTQFHPEVSDNNGKTILKNFLDVCNV